LHQNTRLLRKTNTDGDRRQTILGFMHLMELIGEDHLYAVRSKAMALLKLALQDEAQTECVQRI
jgi:hypothetical protein